LENARFLNLMMRHSDKVKIANRSNLANSFCGATILTAASGTGVLRQASHYIMKLYSLHAKPVPLAMERHDEKLDVFACASDDLKSVAVFVVNPTTDEVKFVPTFDGFDSPTAAVKAETVCDVQNRRQPDVENHWNEPERIRIDDVPVTGGDVTLPPLSATVIEASARQ
jgi:alpha-L-arabinofuranosidase